MSTAVPAPERIAIAGPVGPLEAVVEDPATGAAAFAIVCHPHPLFGGTMDNKVVTTVARALQACGLATIRFNFRGVGASPGEYDHGRGETDDAAAVAAWGETRFGVRAVVAAGFSFGGYVALRLAQSRPLQRLITVAPPVNRMEFAALPTPACPWLIVQGDADEVVDPAAVSAWAGGLGGTVRFVVMPGVGHFFHGRLQELRDAVIEEVRSGRG